MNKAKLFRMTKETEEQLWKLGVILHEKDKTDKTDSEIIRAAIHDYYHKVIAEKLAEKEATK